MRSSEKKKAYDCSDLGLAGEGKAGDTGDMKRILTGLVVFGFLAAASTARATTLGTITTADGLLFTLSSDPSATDLDGDGLGDDLLFTLTLATDLYTGSDSQYISWVSPNAIFHDGIQQESAPDASWVFTDGGANNANGCDGIEASGKWCSQTADTNTVLDGTLYTWTWTVDPNGELISPPHLQAAWFGPDGKQAISVDFAETSGGTDTGATDTGATDTGNEVPEPTSMLLLGSGLAAAALRMRRNQK
jgi:hypothetical protein